MRRVSAKIVPKLLIIDQKHLRSDIAQNMLDNANCDSNFLETVITGDEIWVSGHNLEIEMQSSQ